MSWVNDIQQWRKRRAAKKVLTLALHLRHVDDDILSARDRTALDATIAAGRAVIAAPRWDAADDAAWQERYTALARRLRPHPALRELLDVLAVALVVAFGIRGLFFQPFKIPTSSMQPTLYGIHYIDTLPARAADGVSPWFGNLGAIGNYLGFSARRAHLTVTPPGRVSPRLERGKTLGIFTDTLLNIGSRSYRLPGEPAKVAEYTALQPEQYVAGTLCDGFLSDGDHLFVNRLSLHWREPERGDVMVFATAGIVGPAGERPAASGDYYIKRLVGLPGDTLKIVDNELFVQPAGATEFRPIASFSPELAKLYSKQGGYQGHNNRIPGVTHYLRNNHETLTIPADEYFMLGDNTMFSADSRVWGTVPRANLVGRASVIFWPFSRRWGRVDRTEPLAVPTGEPGARTFKSMNLQ